MTCFVDNQSLVFAATFSDLASEIFFVRNSSSLYGSSVAISLTEKFFKVNGSNQCGIFCKANRSNFGIFSIKRILQSDSRGIHHVLNVNGSSIKSGSNSGVFCNSSVL